MSEEIVNAAVIVPRSIVFSYTYNGILGFGILLTALFCRGDLDTVLNPPSGYAFIEIFLQATESTTGAAVMTCIITVMQLAASISILTSSSRMLWSFARDHGVPGWRILSKVGKILHLHSSCNIRGLKPRKLGILKSPRSINEVQSQFGASPLLA